MDIDACNVMDKESKSSLKNLWGRFAMPDYDLKLFRVFFGL